MAFVSAIGSKALVKPVVLAAALVAGAIGLAGSAEAAGGCGPGFHPNPWGVCRPNYGYGPRPYWRRPVPVYGYGYARPRPIYRPYGYGGPRPFY